MTLGYFEESVCAVCERAYLVRNKPGRASNQGMGKGGNRKSIRAFGSKICWRRDCMRKFHRYGPWMKENRPEMYKKILEEAKMRKRKLASTSEGRESNRRSKLKKKEKNVPM